MQENPVIGLQVSPIDSEPTDSGRRQPAWDRLVGLLPGPHATLFLVLLFALLLRIGWLDTPKAALIFDEAYYVNAARAILGDPVPEGAAYSNQPEGIDPNREHPPLGKLLLAGSMEVFGDNALGWRFTSLVTGMIAIWLVYGIVRAAGGDQWLGVLAAALFSLDNMGLVHSRVGTLDMQLTMFMLLGAWLYLKGWAAPAGVACALAALTKLGGGYALGALILYEGFMIGKAWWTTETWDRPRMLKLGQSVAAFFVVWVGLLWLMDVWVTNFSNPFSHLKFMVDYALELKRANGPANQESYPWQWLINEVQMTYMRVDEEIKVGETVTEARALVYFRGAMNPIIIGAAPLAFGYSIWRAWKQNDQLALWTIIWIAATFFPFIPASLIAHRISYIFYFLPTVPWVCIGLAVLLRRSDLPKVVTWCFIFMVVIGFIGYYPIRRF